MVFWKTIGYTSSEVSRDSIPSPTGREIEKAPPEMLSEIRSFLRSYFGDPPKTPVLELAIDPMDHVLFVRDETDQIAGTIRYHFIGN